MHTDHTIRTATKYARVADLTLIAWIATATAIAALAVVSVWTGSVATTVGLTASEFASSLSWIHAHHSGGSLCLRWDGQEVGNKRED
jgi:hypothetical protein